MIAFPSTLPLKRPCQSRRGARPDRDRQRGSSSRFCGTQNMKFDGKDYPTVGPNVPPGSVSSGRRVNGSTLEITDKAEDKVTDTRQVELSPDLRTLTMTVHPVGRSKGNILVFDRE
jgi:hypothetical protein